MFMAIWFVSRSRRAVDDAEETLVGVQPVWRRKCRLPESVVQTTMIYTHVLDRGPEPFAAGLSSSP
jgi:hypothetical protein